MIWAWILSFFTWLSHDPSSFEVEAPKSAAAVAFAYSSLAEDK